MTKTIFGEVDYQIGCLPMGAWPPEGSISNDKVAIVGKNQWCFLYEGSNNYKMAYMDNSLADLAESWAILIENRRIICENKGMNFFQLIIPNKLSLIPEYFSEPLNSETSYILKSLLATYNHSALLVPLDFLRKSFLKNYVYRRNDSHLSAVGNMILTDYVINKIGFKNLEIDKTLFNKVEHIGDLGNKFNPSLSEYFFSPDWESSFFSQRQLIKKSFHPNQGVIGTWQSSVNEHAPIDKKIIVFGNSFFEKIPSWGLSPYFAAIFREFHFVWSPEININYCMNINPDIVIAQTCERFMCKLPKDEL